MGEDHGTARPSEIDEPLHRLRPRTAVVWGVADQIISSGTNVLATIAASAVLDAVELGAFSAGYAAYVISLGLTRGLVGEPLTIKLALIRSHDRSAKTAAGAAIVIGIATGTAVVGAGFLSAPPLKDALLWTGMFLPTLMLQDTLRHLFFVRDQPHVAFWSDFVWAVIFGAFIVLAPGDAGTGHILGAWGAAGSIAGLATLVPAKLVPAALAFREWLATSRGLSGPLTLEFMMLSGTNQGVLYGVGLLAGLAQQGSLFAAVVVMGPLRVLFLGIRAVLVPRAVRIGKGSPTVMYSTMTRTAVLLGVSAAAWGVAATAIPDDVGAKVLGGAWLRAQPLLIPMTIVMVANGLMTGYTLVLRALQDTSASLRARTQSSLLILSCGVAGAGVAGARGAAWGMAASWAAAAGLWGVHASRSAARAATNPESAPVIVAAAGNHPDPLDA